MWRHVVEVFRQEGAANVRWCWCPNIDNAAFPSYAQCYPGDEYVDWLGLDGYNWGGYRGNAWETFTEVFTGHRWHPLNSYERITSLAPGKPLMIGEFGCNEAGDGGARKAAWIRDAYTVAREDFPLIKAMIWYQVPSDTGPQWIINSTPAALGAFKEAIAHSYFRSDGGTMHLTETVTTYNLRYSLTPNRSKPALLAGATLRGNVYVFLTPNMPGIRQVRFHLDDPVMARAPRQIERLVHYDFAGGALEAANPFNTATVVDGSHTITAAVDFTSGATEVVQAGFAVSNA
jgi:hypothetical protein